MCYNDKVENIGVSPSGKASDSDSDISGVRIPAPQPKKERIPMGVRSFFACVDCFEHCSASKAKQNGVRIFPPKIEKLAFQAQGEISFSKKSVPALVSYLRIYNWIRTVTEDFCETLHKNISEMLSKNQERIPASCLLPPASKNYPRGPFCIYCKKCGSILQFLPFTFAKTWCIM